MRPIEVDKSLDHLFRRSHGKLLTSLLAKFGTHNLESVEGAVMESYYRALRVWPYRGQPDRPTAWLYRTACNVMVDSLRRDNRVEHLAGDQAIPGIAFEYNEDEIEDPELKLLFLICHPSLKAGDQLAFMLKTLSGFGDREIANALMLKKTTIKKRLLRARTYLAETNPVFNWPNPREVSRRIQLVHKALYLLFNEGYYSSHPEVMFRKELCIEAMRLCKFLADHRFGNKETYALLALMCYHISRYESRISESGDLILLPDQDRSRWDPYFMKLGGYYLEKSVDANDVRSRYQIEAMISANHCHAKSLAQTNWSLLKDLYTGLYNLTGEQHVLLNLVVVYLYQNKLTAAEKLYKSFTPEDFAHRALYYLVGIKLYEHLKDHLQVELLLEKATMASHSARELAQLSSIEVNKE